MIPKNSDLNVSLYKNYREDGQIDCQYHYELTMPNGSSVTYIQDELAANEKEVGNVKNFNSRQLGDGAYIKPSGDTEPYNIAYDKQGAYVEVMDEVDETYREGYSDNMDAALREVMVNLSTQEDIRAKPHAVIVVDNEMEFEDLSRAPVMSAQLNISKREIGNKFADLILDDTKKGEYVIATNSKGKVSAIPKDMVTEWQFPLADINLDEAAKFKPQGDETSNSRRLGDNYSSNSTMAYHLLAAAEMQGQTQNAVRFHSQADWNGIEVNLHIEPAMTSYADTMKFKLDPQKYPRVIELASKDAKLSDVALVDVGSFTVPDLKSLGETLEGAAKYANDEKIVVALTGESKQYSAEVTEMINKVNEAKAAKGITPNAAVINVSDTWMQARNSKVVEQAFDNSVEMYLDNAQKEYPKNEAANYIAPKKAGFKP